MKIKIRVEKGNDKRSLIIPASQLEASVASWRDHGYSVEILEQGNKISMKSIFVSINEQRAAASAIERERKIASKYCPDCGRKMEMDGGYYFCEYCEG